MIAPPEVVVPPLGLVNAIDFVVETYEIGEVRIDTNRILLILLSYFQLTTERLQVFRVATAEAIRRYCSRKECLLITTDGEQELV